MLILVQFRFAIIVLTRKPEAYVYFFAIAIYICIRFAVTKSVTVPTPDNGLFFICRHSRGVQMVGVDIVNILLLELTFTGKAIVNLRQWFAAQPDVIPGEAAFPVAMIGLLTH